MSAAGKARSGSGSTTEEPVNDVVLRGRLSGDPEEREPPSGDRGLRLGLILAPPAQPRASHDTLDCAAYESGVRRSLLRWRHGDVVEVRGSLHRRFFRAGAGPVSRYEVEVAAVRRVATAGTGRGTMTG